MRIATEVTEAVLEYYGIAGVSAYTTGNSSSILEDNTVYGSWSDSYLTYNCYAYAIGRDDWIEPGVLDWTNQGNDKDDYYYNQLANIQTIAGWVKDDLESLGYTVIKVSTARPIISVTDTLKLICVRKDEDGTSSLLGTTYDFHFMKLEKDGNWYHKPGKTNPLKYKYTPSNTRVWTSEGYGYNALHTALCYSRNEDKTYDSTIYYNEYETAHTWTYSYCGTNDGTHQHIKTCSGCGETSGSATACTYKATSSNCTVCGHNKDLIVTSLGNGGYTKMDDIA